MVQATFILALAIIAEAGLSYVGAGTPPPQPSWGNILADGRSYLHNGWWMTTFPGLFIMISVLGLNILGDGLRDKLDPRMESLRCPGPCSGTRRKLSQVIASRLAFWRSGT